MILLWSAMKFIVTSILSSHNNNNNKTSISHCDENTKGHAEDYQWNRKLENGKVSREPHTKYFQSWLYFIESMKIVINSYPKKLEGMYINSNTFKNATKNLKLLIFMENWGNKVACLFILNMPSEFLFLCGKTDFLHTILWWDLRKIGGNDGELL